MKDYAGSSRLLNQQHEISNQDLLAVKEALESGSIARGVQADLFEVEFAKYVGAKYAVSCSSGTAALHMAVLAWDTHKTVLEVPTLTFAATANAALMAGKGVELYDNMDEKKFGDKLDIIMHYAGQVTHSWGVIEDACHALGAEHPHGEKVGEALVSLMVCFSFHPSKHITTGEGGMVTTNNIEYYRRLQSLKDNGREDGIWQYQGLNYHMPEIAAALGRSQLRRADEFLNTRRNLAYEYYSNLPSIAVPYLDHENHSRNSYHLFPVLIDFDALNMSREKVILDLKVKGINTIVHYIPLHKYPKGMREIGRDIYSPEADSFYRQTLSLPMHTGLDRDDIHYVCRTLKEVLV